MRQKAPPMPVRRPMPVSRPIPQMSDPFRPPGTPPISDPVPPPQKPGPQMPLLKPGPQGPLIKPGLSGKPAPNVPPMSGTMAPPKMAKGGKVGSASKRADGIAERGKTKGRII